MLAKAARISSLVCSAAAIFAILQWLRDGAPLATDLRTALSTFLFLLDRPASWAQPAMFTLAAITVAFAAGLGAALLIRGARVEAAVRLGTVLGWTSLAAAYFFFVSATPHVTLPLAAWYAADAAAFALVGLASREYFLFWLSHPRRVTLDEVLEFLERRLRADLSGLGGWRMRIQKFLHGKHDPVAWQLGNARRQLDWFASRPPWVFAACAAGLAMPLWRLPGIVGEPVASGIVFYPLLFALAFPFIGCNFAMAIIALHRASGSPGERRKVEWIRMSVFAATLVLFLFCALFTLTTVLMLLAPEWVQQLRLIEISLGGAFVSMLLWPLAVLVGHAVSVFYGGSLDPKLALGRFTLWSGLGLVLMFMFVMVEKAIASGVVQWLALPSQSATLAAGAIIGLTFKPLKKKFEGWTARLLERVMPEAVLVATSRHAAAIAVTEVCVDDLAVSASLQREARAAAGEHSGRLVKTTPDGCVLYFAVPENALAAVKALHAKRADGALRSSLHWGDLVEGPDGDVVGFTVNVATRIADVARPGEIVASREFVASLEDGDLPAKPLGRKRLRNLQASVECVKLAL